MIHLGGWRGYNGLVDFGYKKHFRVHHAKNEFARGNSRINGIEWFWGYAKTRLTKVRGMNKSKFELHIKECDKDLIIEGKIFIRFCLLSLEKDRLTS